MEQSTDVNDWNNRRDMASTRWSSELISVLDASGLIVETLNK